MANVNYFKEFCQFVMNKTQSGRSFTEVQFNQVANQAQLQIFERDFQLFMQTERITEFLKTFLKKTVLNVPATGESSYPSDYQHLSALRKYYVKTNGQGKMIEIKEVKNVNWGLMQMSQLMEPTLRFPKYSEFSDVIRFLPKNIGIVEIDYFKTPTAPVWGYVTTSGRPVYDPTASTDFEFVDTYINEVAAIFLSLVGCNLKDTELAGFTQMWKAENNNPN
jgi:hypothetical protein